MAKAPSTSNQANAALFALADELGTRVNTLSWVLGGVRAISDGKSGVHVTARSICAALVRDVNTGWKGHVEDGLRSLGIERSEDVGRIVVALARAGFLQVREGEKDDDFRRIFITDSISSFLAQEGITRARWNWSRIKRRVSWMLYGTGFAIVAASYVRLVSNRVAWIGWIVGMAGFAIFYIKNPERKRF